MQTKSIVARIILLIGLTTLALLAVSSWVSYNQTRQILEETIFDAAAAAAQQNARLIENWLTATGNELSALASTSALRSMDWSLQLPVLQDVVAARDDYEMMYVVDTKGNGPLLHRGRSRSERPRLFPRSNANRRHSLLRSVGQQGDGG